MTAEGTEDIVARLRDQCCRLGHDDHGHTNCWLFGRAAAEIERLRAENTTLRERTTPFEGDKSYSGDDERITEAFGAARSERFDRR